MHKPIRILLVEDEEADIVHFQRVSCKLGLDAEIVAARNGDAALAALRADADNRRCVVVTDLNMPGPTGHELIEELRNDPRLATHAVFVLSSSSLEDDIDQAYRRHVAGYIVKDPMGERIEAGISMLERYARAVALRGAWAPGVPSPQRARHGLVPTPQRRAACGARRLADACSSRG